jgi:hypothetical protein
MISLNTHTATYFFDLKFCYFTFALDYTANRWYFLTAKTYLTSFRPHDNLSPVRSATVAHGDTAEKNNVIIQTLFWKNV